MELNFSFCISFIFVRIFFYFFFFHSFILAGIVYKRTWQNSGAISCLGRRAQMRRHEWTEHRMDEITLSSIDIWLVQTAGGGRERESQILFFSISSGRWLVARWLRAEHVSTHTHAHTHIRCMVMCCRSVAMYTFCMYSCLVFLRLAARSAERARGQRSQTHSVTMKMEKVSSNTTIHRLKGKQSATARWERANGRKGCKSWEKFMAIRG